MTKDEADTILEELSIKLNNLSDEKAQGDAFFTLERNDNNWVVGVSGSLCTGDDKDGFACWINAAEVLNDDSWSGRNLKELIEKVENIVNEASL